MIEFIELVLAIVVAMEISISLKGKRAAIRDRYIRVKRTFVNWIKRKFPEAAAWQIHAVGNKDYQTPEGIRVIPAVSFLQQLI